TLDNPGLPRFTARTGRRWRSASPAAYRSTKVVHPHAVPAVTESPSPTTRPGPGVVVGVAGLAVPRAEGRSTVGTAARDAAQPARSAVAAASTVGTSHR